MRRFPGPGRGVGHPSMSQLKRWCFTSMSCTPSFSGFFSFSCRATETRVSAPRPEKRGGSICRRNAGTPRSPAARQRGLLHCPPPRRRGEAGRGPAVWRAPGKGGARHFPLPQPRGRAWQGKQLRPQPPTLPGDGTGLRAGRGGGERSPQRKEGRRCCPLTSLFIGSSQS